MFQDKKKGIRICGSDSLHPRSFRRLIRPFFAPLKTLLQKDVSRYRRNISLIL